MMLSRTWSIPLPFSRRPSWMYFGALPLDFRVALPTGRPASGWLPDMYDLLGQGRRWWELSSLAV